MSAAPPPHRAPIVVRPPKQRRAFSTFGGPVETGGEPEQARALEKLFRVEADRERALTHGFHSYAGRMHPSIARGALERWSAADNRILDPFCGSGTVLVEAMALGRRAAGIDASPLAVLIASVRTTLLGAEGRARLVKTAVELADAAAEQARKRVRPEIPPWARKETQRFSAHVALELLGLRARVWETPNDDVGRALRACFSSMLVKFMSRGPQAPRDGEGKRIGRGVPSRFFAARAEELARGLATLERESPRGTPPAWCRLGDARGYPDIAAASVDMVLSSPPYAGTYDYAEHHEVRFTWLGLSQGPLTTAQLGTRDRGLGTSLRIWREGRRRWLREIGRVLKPGAHVVLVMGDGVVGLHPEDAAAAIADEAPGARLVPIARASQLRPLRDRRLLEIFGDQPRREHILLLRKGP